MEPINLTTQENEVPVIRFLVIDKLISLPVTGPRLIAFKAAMTHAMGVTRKSDLAKLGDNIEVDEKQSIAAVDEMLRDCPDTASLAGTLSIAVYVQIIAELNRILFGDVTKAQSESEVKKK